MKGKPTKAELLEVLKRLYGSHKDYTENHSPQWAFAPDLAWSKRIEEEARKVLARV